LLRISDLLLLLPSMQSMQSRSLYIYMQSMQFMATTNLLVPYRWPYIDGGPASGYDSANMGYA
jgi:hypothetical protein